MSFKIKTYKVTATLLQPILGTVPTADIWAEHLSVAQTRGMKKDGKTDEEIKEALKDIEGDIPELDEKGLTSFLKDEQGYYLASYMVRGFLKAAATAMKEHGKMKQLKNKVSQWVFVKPYKIYLTDNPNAELEIVARPLRAETPMGPRTAIARSHSIPAGTKFSFEIHTLNDSVDAEFLKELLSYGFYQGVGQNRGAGYGSFEFELEEN